MKFSLSELYCIEDAITSKRKEWLTDIRGNNDPDYNEVTKEFDYIIEKVKKEIKDQEGYTNAFSTLFSMPRPKGGSPDAKEMR